MKEEKITTLHPQGKKGVNISLARYEQIKSYILTLLKKKGEMTFEALGDTAVKELTASFDGKVLWYIVTVKLDLEARGLIERVPKTSPHRLRLKA